MDTVVWLFKKKPIGAMSLLIVVFWIVVAIFPAQFSPYDPTAQSSAPLMAPNAEHRMGTDRFGRDVLSRVVYGARISMTVGVGTIAIAFVVSLAVGVTSAFAGGALDSFVQRIVDILLSFPGLLLALLLANLLGQSLLGVILAIGFVRTVHGIRGVRGLVLQEKEREYVTAAEVVGSSTLSTCFKHIVPNIMPLVIITVAGGIGDSILAEASLSFLGLGVPHRRLAGAAS